MNPVATCDAVEDCVTGAELFANFPNSTSAFEVKYHDEENALARGVGARGAAVALLHGPAVQL